MNTKAEKSAYIKRELSELETQEELTKQYLSSITSRKRYLESELLAVGGSVPARKGKRELSNAKKFSLMANLTKGSDLHT